MAKVLIAMENKIIPANLHFNSPNPDIQGLQDGRLKVISQNTPWSGGLVGINSFGFGGSNVHALLKSNNAEERLAHAANDSPRLFTFSARTEEGLQYVLDQAQENASNVELHALLAENACSPASTHPYRGFTVLNTQAKPQEIQVSAHPYKTSIFLTMGLPLVYH